MVPHTNGFTNAEQALIREAVRAVMAELTADPGTPPCSWGRRVNRMLWVLVGVGMGSSGLSIAAIVKLML